MVLNAFRRPQSEQNRRPDADDLELLLSRVLGGRTHARASRDRACRIFFGAPCSPRARAASPVLQVFTFAILLNTSFQGFPRLAALLARDRYFPGQFVNLGDRLVHSNGIFVLMAPPPSRSPTRFKANVNSRSHVALHALPDRNGALLAPAPGPRVGGFGRW